MTKLYAQEKRVFDINKVTVVGSPTITSNGVASGFSSSNFLSLSPININNIQRLDIECSFLVGDNISTQQFPFGSTTYAQLSLQIRNGVLMANTGTNNSWQSDVYIIENLQPNTLVYLKCHFTTKGRNFEYSTDGVNYISVTGDTFTLIGDTYAFTPRIGLGRSGTAPFLGSIDLTAFKIYVDGELVYSPTKPVYYLERKKEGFDLSKFIVVGNPTITSDGVASGFSNSNYIKTGFVLSDLYNKKWTIKTRTVYEYLDNVGTFGVTLYSNISALQWLNKGNLGIMNKEGNIYFHAQTIGGTEGRKITINKSETNLKDGDVVDLELSFDLTMYTLKAIINNSHIITKSWTPTTDNKNLLGTQTSETIYINCRQGGGERMDSNSLFDLKQFSIIVDGKEVFTGAKEKFYAMRGM